MFDGDRAARASRLAWPTLWRSRAGKSPSRQLPHTRRGLKGRLGAALRPQARAMHAVAAGRNDNR